MNDLRDELVAEIRRVVREHPANRFPGTDEPIFDEPLVGFAPADDPIWGKYKEIIGPFHWSPQEALEAGGGRGEARTVVSWILPITEATRRDNRAETRLPSRRWAHTRWHGEAFNEELRRAVVGFLAERGHGAVAPCLVDGWRVMNDPRVGLASTWSERHAAYAAGLGTFSLNDALITERGIAHRTGSVVTTAEIAPTPRAAAHHRANCAFYSAKGCGVCIGRCPVGAISEAGHDKERCRAYTYGRVMDEVGERFGVKVAGCGLCQTKVPCEHRVPPAAREG
ncbi:MAG: epoxyqueuosine reductase [Candidatus Dadabacteria bacterium]|nr:MAG: epoxyqueuosine reductase [Candidatus Dadabacteria bacterium]